MLFPIVDRHALFQLALAQRVQHWRGDLGKHVDGVFPVEKGRVERQPLPGDVRHADEHLGLCNELRRFDR